MFPKHIGIIPDGSRRWARKNGKSLYEGYFIALENLTQLINQVIHLGGTETSIYLLSRENLKRPQNDLNALFEAMNNSFSNSWRSLIENKKINLHHVGITDNLPGSLLASWNSLLDLNKNNLKNEQSFFRLNILLDYDPYEELHQAYIKNAKYFRENLWVNSPIDLIVRTAGVPLLSNFLPLQSGYAILYTSPKLFNDLTSNDLDDAFEYFSKINHLHGA